MISEVTSRHIPSSAVYQRFGKRLLDLFVSTIVLAAILPLLAVVWLCVFVALGSPVLFRQERAGLRGRTFTLFKFRSMNDARDERGDLLSDSQRLTTFGRILRSTSVDELPGLWNVLRGDLSLIGPRPLPVAYDAYYTDEQRKRLDAKPGLAGYAALFGRNAQSWESIFERDAWYVEHISLLLDLKILFGIALVVLSGKGIDRGDHNRESEFQRRIEARSRSKG